MKHDTTTELSFNAFLLDVLCTVLAFLAAFWLRRFVPDDGTVDLYSHLFLIPLLLSLTIGSLSWFGVTMARTKPPLPPTCGRSARRCSSPSVCCWRCSFS